MQALPMPARLFITAVVSSAIAVLGLAIPRVTDWGAVAVLLAVVVASEYLTLSLGRSVSGVQVSISVTAPMVIGAVFLLGPWGAAAVGAGCWLQFTRDTPLVKVLFNGAQVTLSGWLAGWIYLAFGGTAPIDSGAFPGVLIPITMVLVSYELINGAFVVGYISLANRVAPARVWRGMLAESALAYFAYNIFGLLLAVVWGAGVGPFSVVLLLVPLAVARWVFALFAREREAYEATIRSFIQAVETKDAYTRGHSERVAKASLMIGRTMNVRDDRLETLRFAGMLHDVGKLGVPTKVLQKAGKLTEEEFAAIQLHPVRGREITRELEFLGEAIIAIYHHHERIDGRGYPLGLVGDDIPEFARMIAVADAFDSMTTTRSYRGARSVDEAVEELIKWKGTQFDAEMVEAMIEALAAEPWQPTDTSALFVGPQNNVPNYASDDDDPTAAEVLASHRPSAENPRPAGEKSDNYSTGRRGESS
jgi:hypothetical protein